LSSFRRYSTVQYLKFTVHAVNRSTVLYIDVQYSNHFAVQFQSVQYTAVLYIKLELFTVDQVASM